MGGVVAVGNGSANANAVPSFLTDVLPYDGNEPSETFLAEANAAPLLKCSVQIEKLTDKRLNKHTVASPTRVVSTSHVQSFQFSSTSKYCISDPPPSSSSHSADVANDVYPSSGGQLRGSPPTTKPVTARRSLYGVEAMSEDVLIDDCKPLVDTFPSSCLGNSDNDEVDAKPKFEIQRAIFAQEDFKDNVLCADKVKAPTSELIDAGTAVQISEDFKCNQRKIGEELVEDKKFTFTSQFKLMNASPNELPKPGGVVAPPLDITTNDDVTRFDVLAEDTQMSPIDRPIASLGMKSITDRELDTLTDTCCVVADTQQFSPPEEKKVTCAAVISPYKSDEEITFRKTWNKTPLKVEDVVQEKVQVEPRTKKSSPAQRKLRRKLSTPKVVSKPPRAAGRRLSPEAKLEFQSPSVKIERPSRKRQLPRCFDDMVTDDTLTSPSTHAESSTKSPRMTRKRARLTCPEATFDSVQTSSADNPVLGFEGIDRNEERNTAVSSSLKSNTDETKIVESHKGSVVPKLLEACQVTPSTSSSSKTSGRRGNAATLTMTYPSPLKCFSFSSDEDDIPLIRFSSQQSRVEAEPLVVTASTTVPSEEMEIEESCTASSTRDEYAVVVETVARGADEAGYVACSLDEAGSVACDVDEAGSVACGLDEPGSVASGADEAGSVDCGADEAGSMARGLDEPGSVASGADEAGSVACGADEAGSMARCIDLAGSVACGVDVAKSMVRCTDEASMTICSDEATVTLCTNEASVICCTGEADPHVVPAEESQPLGSYSVTVVSESFDNEPVDVDDTSASTIHVISVESENNQSTNDDTSDVCVLSVKPEDIDGNFTETKETEMKTDAPRDSEPFSSLIDEPTESTSDDLALELNTAGAVLAEPGCTTEDIAAEASVEIVESVETTSETRDAELSSEKLSSEIDVSAVSRDTNIAGDIQPLTSIENTKSRPTDIIDARREGIVSDVARLEPEEEMTSTVKATHPLKILETFKTLSDDVSLSPLAAAKSPAVSSSRASGIDRIVDIPETPTSTSKKQRTVENRASMSRGQRMLLTSTMQRSHEFGRESVAGPVVGSGSDENSLNTNLTGVSTSVVVSQSGSSRVSIVASSPLVRCVYSPSTPPSAGILRRRLVCTDGSIGEGPSPSGKVCGILFIREGKTVLLSSSFNR